MNNEDARDEAVRKANKDLGVPISRLTDDLCETIVSYVRKKLKDDSKIPTVHIPITSDVFPAVTWETWYLCAAKPQLKERLRAIEEWKSPKREVNLVFDELGSRSGKVVNISLQ